MTLEEQNHDKIQAWHPTDWLTKHSILLTIMLDKFNKNNLSTGWHMEKGGLI